MTSYRGEKVIQLENIGKYYKTAGQKEYILKELSLDIKKGEFVAIMGPSGSGKSTLLHILGGLDRPNEGTYQFQEHHMERLSERKRAKVRNEQIGFVFQNFQLIANLSVYQNVILPLTYNKGFIHMKKKKALEALKAVGLEHHIYKRPHQLSGGQKQRVAIARAIINQPSFILADEPTGSLDEENSNGVMDVFDALHQQGTTILLITHDQHVAKRANRIFYMQHGKAEESIYATS